MLNKEIAFSQMRVVIDNYEPGRERALAITKLDECEMWLGRCRKSFEEPESKAEKPQ